MPSETKLAAQLAPDSRILVARLDSLGDCVLSSSFFIGLRRLFPAAHLTGVFSAATAPLFENCPLFDRILRAPRTPGEAWSALLEPPYDLAICPRWDVDHWSTRRFAAMSEAPIRVGFDRGPYRYDEPLDGWAAAYFTHLARTQSDAHEVAKGRDLLHFMGATEAAPNPQLWLPASATTWADEFARERLSNHFAVLAVSAAWERRVWPVENFLPVIDALRRQEPDLRFVVVGADDAAGLGAWLQQMRPESVLCAAGTSPLLSSAALIARSCLYIGMDTGPMHLAASSGVPVVEISCHPRTGSPEHPNSPERFGPYATRSHVLRPARPLPPCTDGCTAAREPHCITQVTAADVIEAALSLLA